VVLEGQPGHEAVINEVAAAAGLDRDEVRQWAIAPDVREAVAMTDDVLGRLRRSHS
jgi:predicted DsbA family dithiol-disulfide isomerase